jgi:hypothetical protein
VPPNGFHRPIAAAQPHPAGREEAEVLSGRARGDLLSAYGIIAEI